MTRANANKLHEVIEANLDANKITASEHKETQKLEAPLDSYLVSEESSPTLGKQKLFLPWEERYNLGIDLLDQQHKKVVDVVNQLHASMKSQNRQAHFIENMLGALDNYIEVHFKTEEKIFLATKYPALNDHMKQHALFKGEVQKLHDDLSRSVVSVNAILQFVLTWFIEHSQSSDRMFVEYWISQKKQK